MKIISYKIFAKYQIKKNVDKFLSKTNINQDEL